jgi:hypothetical protein
MAYKKGTRVRVVADTSEGGRHGIKIGSEGTVRTVHSGKIGGAGEFMWREDESKYYKVDLDDHTGAFFWPEELERVKLTVKDLI